jgi:hypothetical protein
MGTKGAKMQPREPNAPVLMQDVLEWWQQLEEEHGDEVEMKWALVRGKETTMVRISVIARNPGIGHKGEVVAEKSVVWPTGSHRTVLGAVLWLFIGLDDEYTADEALAGMVSTR